MYINAAEYLQEIRATNIAIHNKKRALRTLDSMLEARAITYSPDRTNGTPRKDALEELAMKHIEEREKIVKEIEEKITWMYKRIDEASDFINQIESEEQREVLTLRYISMHSWSEIMVIRECDDISGQYKLHKMAIDSLQEILEREWNKKK
jgi:uncharacterized protein with von Willebrand factor type A (vWA) domain